MPREVPRNRVVAAHHEAGHAVAAVMRGGSRFTSLEFSDDGSGLCRFNGKVFVDGGFFAYAGPWAEARFAWSEEGLPLDAEDDDWCTFADRVTGVLLAQPSDMGKVLSQFERSRALLGLDARSAAAGEVATEGVWCMELERVWPVVVEVARQALAAKAVTDQVIRDLVDAQWSEGDHGS